MLVALGLLAIGVSGLLTAGERAVASDEFVAGALPGVTYTRARCEDLHEYSSRRSCRAAAAAHHSDEVIFFRIAAGVLGIPVLLGWLIARRRDRGEPLPPTLVPAIGVTVFGVAALGLGAATITSLVLDAGGGGAGQWLSGAVVAAIVAAAFGSRFVTALVEQPLGAAT